MRRERKRVQTKYPKNSISKTKTYFAKKTNINNIVRRYGKTGMLSTGLGESGLVPRFEFNSGADYFSMMCKVAKAKSEFAALPALVRQRFSNNPQLCIDFISKLDNRDLSNEMGKLMSEANDLGLLDKKAYANYLDRKHSNDEGLKKSEPVEIKKSEQSST